VTIKLPPDVHPAQPVRHQPRHPRLIDRCRSDRGPAPRKDNRCDGLVYANGEGKPRWLGADPACSRGTACAWAIHLNVRSIFRPLIFSCAGPEPGQGLTTDRPGRRRPGSDLACNPLYLPGRWVRCKNGGPSAGFAILRHRRPIPLPDSGDGRARLRAASDAA
jgi:hypothetical protein